MKQITLVSVLVMLAGMMFAQSSDYTIPVVRDPVRLTNKLNVDGAAIGVRLGQVEALGITNTTSAVVVGSLTTTGTVATAKATVSGTLAVTGVATLTAMPKFTTTNAPGAVVASPLNNLPTSATTNALFFTITVGAVNYAVPMYALP
jgi:hypothetical protein